MSAISAPLVVCYKLSDTSIKLLVDRWAYGYKLNSTSMYNYDVCIILFSAHSLQPPRSFYVLMRNHIEKPVSFLPSLRDATQLAKLWVFSVTETIVGHVYWLRLGVF